MDLFAFLQLVVICSGSMVSWSVALVGVAIDVHSALVMSLLEAPVFVAAGARAFSSEMEAFPPSTTLGFPHA